MTLPLILTVLVGAAWSTYWYFALDIAKAQFARLKSGDLAITCENETWSGFPFRFTLICDTAAFRLGTGKTTASGQADRLSATVRAYEPNHVIAEIGPPFTITYTMSPQQNDLALPDTVIFNSGTSVLRAGALLTGGKLKQVSVRSPAWRGKITATAAGRPIEKADTTADLLAINWTPARPESPDAVAAVLSLQAENLVYAGALGARHGMRDLTVDNAGLQATLVKTEISTALLSRSGLRTWQAGGGEVNVSHFNFSNSTQQVEGSGTIRLDSEGRLEGRSDLLVKGMDETLRGLVDSGRLSSTQAVLASTAIGLLSQTGNKARPGWTGVPVRATKGRLYFGPFKAATLAPLF